MISHQHQCIFIHIPKCAGTSIERALGHLDHHQGRWGQDHRTMSDLERSIGSSGPSAFGAGLDKALQFCRLRKKPKSNPNNRLVVTRAQYDAYYKFAIVRNPWARAYSWYQNIMRDELKRQRHQVSTGLSLKEFLREQVGKDSLRPQTYWLKSLDGSIQLDFIGRFETLREDFAQACDTMGIPHIRLPHELKGSTENPLQHIDDESAEIIANAYREEIELFNYQLR